MANESTNNAKKEKFIGLLHELFQLNQPELDFGLYRIMHAKSDQIKAFIQNDLASEIDEAFADSGDDKIAELKASYEQARAQAVEFGIDDPDSNPKVKAAKEAYDTARDNGDDPSDIYDHLYRFFSRYYDKGDFLSRRYHVGENESRAAPYAVPYDGREVYLHWANKDQYYIKSSEYLSNYSFDLLEAVEKERKRQGAIGQEGLNFGGGDSGNPIKVTFQLVDATEGAHNNVKENQARFFIIHADKPIEVRPSVSSEGKPNNNELIINFEYRPDPEKSGQESGWQKKRLQEAESVILEALKSDDNLKTFHDALRFLVPTEKQKDRTILTKYLTSYTARNTMDYFIHKDLGSFLNRELDFYIKNEIMRLDDLSSDDIDGVSHSLKKITALRSIARQIIGFLAQLENFQKKLWLKKKFVTEVNYCITLDRVPSSFYEEIVANQKQWHEWKQLGLLEDLEPSLEALQKQQFMMVDTGLYEESFKERLLSQIDGLDEQCEGVLINSENFQGLNLLSSRFLKAVSVIYADPPYNTSASEINYKNSYKHSSWLSLIANRISLGKKLLCPDQGIQCTTIDDVEHKVLSQLLEDTYGEIAGTVSIRIKPSGRPIPNGFALSHEYAVFTRTSEFTPIKRLEHSEEQANRYKEIDDKGRFFWEMFRKAGSNSNRSDRPSMFYPFFLDEELNVRLPEAEFDDVTQEFELKEQPKAGETVLYPIKDDGSDGRWYFGYKRAASVKDEFKAERSANGDIRIYYRRRPNEGVQPTSLWFDSKYSATEHGTALLKNLFGKQDVFSYPKSIHAVEDCLTVSGAKAPSSLILDYFAGSGTTGHAVINFNRKDGNRRKYILIEMGDYFDGVLKPRIKKAIFSDTWKDGRPVSIDTGVSNCFKYLRLESYEDTLNNLVLSDVVLSGSMLAMQNQPDIKKDYLLKYFLDVETRGSMSLLNIEKFKDPTAYMLMVKKPGSDSQTSVTLDLVETFNWLIGLQVALLDRPRTYDAEFEKEHDPELPQDQHTRLKVTHFKEDEDGGYWFRVVEGYLRSSPGSNAVKEKVMVIWRKLTDKPEHDAAALEALLSKYRVNQSDTEFDKIYINGPHGLNLSGQAKAKILSIEETFMARMWEETDEAMH